MKPNSLCIVEMGSKGLQIAKCYPDILPKETLNEITIKCMPLGAKDGDFTSTILGNENALSSYVFSIPSDIGRDNIASLVAVFDKANYDSNNVRKIFSVLIHELKRQKAITMDILSQILPSLYKGFDSKKVQIKISSVVTVEINIDDSESPKGKQKSAADYAKSVQNEMWK